MSFHILYGLLNSPLLLTYNQNETSHGLENDCVHVCTKLDIEYLKKLAFLLKSASCDYGRLTLTGLVSDVSNLKLPISDLHHIKSLSETPTA